MKGLPFSIQELFCVEDSDSTGQFFTSETEVTLYYRKLCIIEGSQTSLLKAQLLDQQREHQLGECSKAESWSPLWTIDSSAFVLIKV